MRSPVAPAPCPVKYTRPRMPAGGRGRSCARPAPSLAPRRPVLGLMAAESWRFEPTGRRAPILHFRWSRRASLQPPAAFKRDSLLHRDHLMSLAKFIAAFSISENLPQPTRICHLTGISFTLGWAKARAECAAVRHFGFQPAPKLVSCLRAPRAQHRQRPLPKRCCRVGTTADGRSLGTGPSTSASRGLSGVSEVSPPCSSSSRLCACLPASTLLHACYCSARSMHPRCKPEPGKRRSCSHS